MNQITTGGVPACATPSASGNPSGLGNGTTVIDATLQSGADFGVQISNALAAAYSAGGGTVDGRGFVCPDNCHIGTANLTIGDGVNPVIVFLPAGTITRDSIGGTGPSAQILYNSNVTIYGYGTTIAGGSDTVAVQQAFGSITNVHSYGLRILDSGTVVPRSAALQIGGPNSGIPLVPPPSGSNPGYIASTFGPSSGVYANWFPGAQAHIALYRTALSGTQIAAHYVASSNASTYNALVASDGAFAHFKLDDS